MTSTISINKKVLSKDLSKVIDIEFRQLVQPTITTEFSIEEFFTLYEDLFYQIPKEGDSNSHRYILNKTVEYLGVKLADDIDIQALLDEITSLRQQLVDTQTIITDYTKTKK
jgi:hypothetical protein